MSWRIGLVVILLLAGLPLLSVAAAPPGNQFFDRTWSRTDRPVSDHLVNRTWMWGPEAFTEEIREPFADSPGGQRGVQYFDKSRMEISDVGEDPSSPWYVTNGLLVMEMMTGRMQMGLNAYENRSPAHVNVAGDAEDPLGATYWYFGLLREQAPLTEGTPINLIVSPGAASNLFMYNDHFLRYNVTAAYYVDETRHTVASPFWEFMNANGLVHENGSTFSSALFQNPFYATGFPVTEAYWAVVKVADIDTDVLIQCFERRCLTYTPSNSFGWQVEAGNVGQHYYAWRYGSPSVDEPPLADALPEIITDYYWFNPEVAVASAWAEAGWATGSDPVYAMVAQSAYGFHGLYSMDTAPLGYWNHDMRGFYPWLVGYFTTGRVSTGSHLRDQVRKMVYEPQSNIARQVRALEVEYDEYDLGSGVYAYYDFMFLPLNFPHTQTPMQRTASAGVWEDMVLGYAVQRFSGPTDDGFAAFLASRNYDPPFSFDRD